jgi:hypothetical protein
VRPSCVHLRRSCRGVGEAPRLEERRSGRVGFAHLPSTCAPVKA